MKKSENIELRDMSPPGISLFSTGPRDQKEDLEDRVFHELTLRRSLSSRLSIPNSIDEALLQERCSIRKHPSFHEDATDPAILSDPEITESEVMRHIASHETIPVVLDVEYGHG